MTRPAVQRAASWPLIVLGVCLSLTGRDAVAQQRPLDTDAATRLTCPSSASTGGPRIDLQFDGVPLREVILRLAATAGMRLSYSPDLIPAIRVRVACRGVAVADAFALVLRGRDLVATLSSDGLVVIAPAPRRSASPTTTDSGDMSPAQQLPPTIVRADVVTAAPSLDLLALALPRQPAGASQVTIRGDELRARGSAQLADALRGLVPGLAAWSPGGGTGALRIASARGGSGDGTTGLKIFVDGVEVADPTTVLATDVRTIEAIDVMLGPASSALYGSDAIDGVLHIRSRHALRDRSRTAFTSSVRAGTGQSRYRGTSPSELDAAVLLHLRSRGTDEANATATRGASVSFTGAALRHDAPIAGEASASATATASLSAWQRAWRVGVTARLGRSRSVPPFDPQWALGNDRGPVVVPDTGRPAPAPDALSGPAVRDVVSERSAGAALLWQGGRTTHGVHLGWSRAERTPSFAMRAVSTGDSLRFAWSGPAARLAVRYAGSRSWQPRAGTSLVLHLNADASRLQRAGPDTSLTVNSLGDSTVTRSAAGVGVLLDARVGAFALSGGVRHEWNDALGEQAGGLWLPTLSGTWTVHAQPGTSWRLRAAYGASVRAPMPTLSGSRQGTLFVQRANPSLGAERQVGGEVGVSATFAGGGELRLTHYRQRVDGLIQRVTLPGLDTSALGIRRVVQYQDVGSIDNRGAELSGRWRVGRSEMGGTLNITPSRVRTLSSAYSGPLRQGAPLLESPRYSGGLWWRPRAWSGDWLVGMSLLGPWESERWECAASESPCPGAARTIVGAQARWRLGYGRGTDTRFAWRVQVDNLTGNQRGEGSRLLVSPGRVLSVEFTRR